MKHCSHTLVPSLRVKSTLRLRSISASHLPQSSVWSSVIAWPTVYAVRSREIETVGKRPLVFRVFHFAGGRLYVFIRWNARGKNNRSIPVVLVSFLSKCVSRHSYSVRRDLQILAMTSQL